MKLLISVGDNVQTFYFLGGEGEVVYHTIHSNGQELRREKNVEGLHKQTGLQGEGDQAPLAPSLTDAAKFTASYLPLVVDSDEATQSGQTFTAFESDEDKDTLRLLFELESESELELESESRSEQEGSEGTRARARAGRYKQPMRHVSRLSPIPEVSDSHESSATTSTTYPHQARNDISEEASTCTNQEVPGDVRSASIKSCPTSTSVSEVIMDPMPGDQTVPMSIDKTMTGESGEKMDSSDCTDIDRQQRPSLGTTNASDQTTVDGSGLTIGTSAELRQVSNLGGGAASEKTSIFRIFTDQDVLVPQPDETPQRISTAELDSREMSRNRDEPGGTTTEPSSFAPHAGKTPGAGENSTNWTGPPLEGQIPIGDESPEDEDINQALMEAVINILNTRTPRDEPQIETASQPQTALTSHESLSAPLPTSYDSQRSHAPVPALQLLTSAEGKLGSIAIDIFRGTLHFPSGQELPMRTGNDCESG